MDRKPQHFNILQSTESNMRSIPSFWPNHSAEPPNTWTQRSDQVQLAIIAKENLDIYSITGPEAPETEITTGSQSGKQEYEHDDSIVSHRRKRDKRRKEKNVQRNEKGRSHKKLH